MALHIETPLIRSDSLSKRWNCPVFLKLENLQNSGTFKIRGIGHLCQKAVATGCQRFICSSGGNAGMAAALAGRELQRDVTIIVPETTPVLVRDKLRGLGADVVVHGSEWNAADALAREKAQEPGCQYIPPFDHPDIWEGHSSMMHEIHRQLPAGVQPGLFSVAVGGGGLLCGVLQGMHHQDIGWADVPVVAMETNGCHSFAEAAKSGKVVTLDAITSVATCLGSKAVCQEAVDWCSRHSRLHSVVIEDKETIEACTRFADEHRMLVEPACGAALSAVYGDCLKQLQQDSVLPAYFSSIVVIVCGGNSISTRMLEDWKSRFDVK
eukprot:scpid91314/ scgid2567/ Serine dehydratase-like; L-serine deaminase; L-serine dehydratase/L-threonine deaminase; L-threonine dehydratase; Serine dehydratase 2